MQISLEFYNHLRELVPVSEIVRKRLLLTRKGKEYLGICPFHNEKTPSFTVNDIKRFYHCFGCSAHGDVIRFVSEINGISYKDAAIKIAGENGIELPKVSKAQEKRYEESEQIYNILELASQFFASNLNNDITKYLDKRGVSAESIKDFSIGYAPGGKQLEEFFARKSIDLKDLLKAGLVGKKDDGRIYQIFNKRIMFPIRNIYNKVVGFGGRVIGDSLPKYINSPETLVFKKSDTLYGENIATGHSYKDNYSIIVEGYMDVIALHQAGFKQAVASLGTSVTENHLQKLWRSGDEIISCLDGDTAGMRAAARLINNALVHIAHNKSVSFIELPKGSDPDDLLKASGSKGFSDLLQRRTQLSEMIWKNEYAGKSFNSAESRSALEQKLEDYSAKIEDRTLKANFRRYFKDMIWNNLVRKKKSNYNNNHGNNGNYSNNNSYGNNNGYNYNNNNKTISKELLASKEYSEMEFLEYSICAYMLKFPEIIKKVHEDETLPNLMLENRELDEFKNWIFDIITREEGSADQLIRENVENTGFYDTYLVLSASDTLFLDSLSLNKSNIDQEKVFEWLYKKHYLLLLKKEYMNTLNSKASEEQSKSSSYMEEIQAISKHLAQLSDDFINN
ncbi:MAG: DNA primase [Rickettsiales bacterium]|nr:MAG: DNA primase [Rickettsiales bacterium]